MRQKTLILLSFSTLLTIASFAQTVRLVDLISKSSCKDNECYHDFITNKGFSPAENGTANGGTFYGYQSDDKFTTTSNKTVKTRNQSMFIINDDGTHISSFGSSTKGHYQPLLNELTALGFEKVTSINKNDASNTIETVYKSSRYPKIKLTVSIMIASLEGEKWTYYNIEVNRKP